MTPRCTKIPPAGTRSRSAVAWLVSELVLVWLLITGDIGPGIWVASLLVAVVVGVAFGAAMVGRHTGVWLLPVVPMAALLAMLVAALSVGDEGDGFDPGSAFLSLLILLGLPALVGACGVELWRQVRSRPRGPDS